MTQLRIYVLGTPRAEIDGNEIKLSRRKGLAMLVYLAVTGEAQSRDALATLLWPESDQSAARGSLRRELFSLRNTLQGDWLVTDGEYVTLDRNADIWVDGIEYREHLADEGNETNSTQKRLHAAVDLYRDDFLKGFSLNDCPEFDDWQYYEADGFRQSLMNSLDKLIELHRQTGSTDVATRYARQRLALDVLDESAHRTLIELYALTGKHGAVLRQYKECVRILEQEFGEPPEEETITLFESVRTRQFPKSAADLGAEPIRATSLRRSAVDESTDTTGPQHNLPQQATPFIGREDETDAILTMLRDVSCRLITITGPGGIGKTRLGLAVADAAIADFSGGVWFVPLADVELPNSIPAVIATQLRVKTEGADLTQALYSHLENRNLLLLLDNFEHLNDGALILAELLQHAPNLKLLVTSQERLNLTEESLFPLRGLTIATPNHDGNDEAAALRLFDEAAHRVLPDFSLNDDKSDVIAICEAVDGMPLAIELAASWVRAIPSAELAAELAESLELLHTTLRNVPERHRSMRAVLTRSWTLLTGSEQDSLRKLSVFQGGFDRESALYVAGMTSQLLISLIDRSLIQRLPGGRFNMHGLLHQFSAEMLANSPEEELATRQRHSDYFVGVLSKMPWEFCRPEEVAEEWQQRDNAHAWIVLNFANIQSAWRREIQRGNVDAIYKMKDAFADCLQYSDLIEVGEELFSRAIASLDEPEQLSNPANRGLLGTLFLKRATFMDQDELQGRLKLLERSLSLLREDTERHPIDIAHATRLRAGTFSDLGQKERAVQDLEDALFQFSQAKHSLGVARMTFAFGQLQWGWGELRSASDSLQRAADLFHALDDATRYFALNNLAAVKILQGKYGDADELLQTYVEHYANFEQTHKGLFYAMQFQGDLATAMGRFSEAERLFAAAQTEFERVGDLWVSQLFGYLNQGVLLRLQGRYEKAEQFLDECLDTANRIGWKQGNVVTLNHLSRLKSEQRDYENGLRLAEEALSVARSIHQRFGATNSLCQIGHCRVALEQEAQARPIYAEALAIALAEDIERIACDVLIGIAQLMTADHVDSALALLEFVAQYEASEWEVKRRAEQQIERIRSEATHQLGVHAKPNSQSLSWEAAIDVAQTFLDTDNIPDQRPVS